MNDDIDIGVVLPTGAATWGAAADARKPGAAADARELVDFAVRAEELGFDSVWAGDTLLRPVIETFTVLSAAAAVTSRVRLGTAALLPALRRPVQAAQAIASLDLLSAGRLVLTVGAGFPRRSEAEYALAGVPWAGRFARLDDTVRLWRHLWGGPAFDGAPDMPPAPDMPGQLRPARPGGPPIWLGGASPSALGRAAELYDGWLPYPPDPAAYRDGWEVIRARTERPMTPALFATVLVADDPVTGRRALGEYVQRAYRMPLAMVETIQLLIAGSPADIATTLDRYVAAGARHLVLRIGALGMPAQRTQLELLRSVSPARSVP
jgi:alkanesulfonate monooxygenase SsuD/methylene tetrahydromethanopterin reductase-like flavin-dependent oxidoreductase (luciferase family)